MTSLRFETPAGPPLHSRAARAEAAAEMRARPHQWALLGQHCSNGAARQTAYEIRHGLLAAYAGGGFEARAVTLFDEHRVYARYVGDTDGREQDGTAAAPRCPVCGRPFEDCICTTPDMEVHR